VLVRVGRLVAVVALSIAALVAPQLASLDQVFQYIQEYTGYIYPGVVAVFGMGLFWKQITPNAALWTAIATIPAGVVFKIISPDMPFLLRMGYVFIILCVIACAISFTEKGARVQMPLPEPGRQRQLTTYSYIFFVLGAIALILTIVFSEDYSHLAFEAGYFLSAMLIMIGIILYTNARLELADKRAIVSDPTLFNTATPFNLGAAGIVVILFLIYYFLWY
jgi:SSS family solute:Na+ symporter